MTGAAEGVEVWRGGAAAWECDQAGRLDARFQLAKAMEGLAGLAAAFGMEDAFAPAARSTLIVREHHVRFLKEIRTGTPLVMTAGVAELGEDDARLVQVLRGGRDGEPCAAVLSRVAHVSVREPRPFPWSARARAAAAALSVEPPSFALPRGLPGGPVELSAARPRADELGAPTTGRGVVQAGECDPFGRLRPEAALGRCLEGASHLVDDRGLGLAALEARILYPRAAAAGAGLELRSGVAAVGPRTAQIVHWLLDGADGQPCAAAMVLVGVVDPGARRLEPLPATVRAALETRRIERLGF